MSTLLCHFLGISFKTLEIELFEMQFERALSAYSWYVIFKVA